LSMTTTRRDTASSVASGTRPVNSRAAIPPGWRGALWHGGPPRVRASPQAARFRAASPLEGGDELGGRSELPPSVGRIPPIELSPRRLGELVSGGQVALDALAGLAIELDELDRVLRVPPPGAARGQPERLIVAGQPQLDHEGFVRTLWLGVGHGEDAPRREREPAAEVGVPVLVLVEEEVDRLASGTAAVLHVPIVTISASKAKFWRTAARWAKYA